MIDLYVALQQVESSPLLHRLNKGSLVALRQIILIDYKLERILRNTQKVFLQQ